MSKKITLSILGLVIILNIFSILPAFAQSQAYEVTLVSGADQSFLYRMFPAWISLAGSIALLVIAFKYMSGGSLAKPFILIGLGSLIDTLSQIFSSLILIGIFPNSDLNAQIVWTASLLFRLSVVIGVFWIASIFGVLRHRA